MYYQGYVNYDLDVFRESSRRMFQNIGQISFDCGFAAQKTKYFN